VGNCGDCEELLRTVRGTFKGLYLGLWRTVENVGNCGGNFLGPVEDCGGLWENVGELFGTFEELLRTVRGTSGELPKF
jgi:hypothetical protein